MQPRKKDFIFVTIIGMLVGVLIQLVLENIAKGSPLISGIFARSGFSLRIGIFLAFTVFAPVALGIAYFLGKIWTVLYQFAKFAAVGTLNTAINFGLLNLLSLLTGVATGPMVAVFATVAFLGSTTNSFFWNKFWTFGSQSAPAAGETVKFYLVSVVGWALSVGTVYVVVNFLHPAGVSGQIWLNVGGLCGVAAALFINFVGYKFLVFKGA